jgi:hypothetical protein
VTRPGKKPAHRPLKGEEPLTERLSAMFSERERDALETIRIEKRWTMSTLVREAIEVRYPEVFKKSV